MHATLSMHESALAIRACVTGWSALRVPSDQLAALRKNPGVVPKGPLPPSLLRTADEQTVVGLSAVLKAIESLPADTDFDRWGVLAAPVHFGRIVNHAALKQFQQEGAWGISPNLIPQHSLHALSGTISQVLQARGPNFGIGNAPSAAEEAFLIATTMLSEKILPGLLLVLTGHEREYLPTQPAPDCEAVAFVFQDVRPAEHWLSLRLCPHEDEHSDQLQSLEPFSLSRLVDALGEPAPSGAWRLGPSGWLRLEACSGDNA